MFTQNDIKDANLEDLLPRLSKKNIGGTNQKKGHSYESFFALYKIVKNAALGNLTIQMKEQVANCFVDDLVIQHNKHIDFYQLKNVKTLTWTTKNLIDDFDNQYTLSNHFKQSFNLTLVLSSDKSFNKLIEMPSKSYKKTFVKYFPEIDNIENMIITIDDFKTWLIKLSAKSNPSLMDLDYLAKNILSEWIDLSSSTNFISIDSIIKKASKRKSTPIKTSWIKSAEWTRVEKILKKIPNLNFSTENGIFEYWLGEFDYGFIDSAQTSKEFKNFSKRILNKKPKTIEGFEELL